MENFYHFTEGAEGGEAKEEEKKEGMEVEKEEEPNEYVVNNPFRVINH